MQAASRLRGRVRTTSLMHAASLSRESGATVLLKLESEQHTGSFKYRGALNKLLTLGTGPIMAASTGNHGMAVARAMQETGISGRIYLPETADDSKVAALRKSGEAGEQSTGTRLRVPIQ